MSSDADRPDAPPTPDTVGALLKRHRLAAGLTQAELADRAHISLHALSNVERGTARLPHRSTLDLIATALALSPEDHDALLLALRIARGLDPSTLDAAAPLALTLPPLPTPLTLLLGRDELLSDLDEALRQHSARLLTLVGSPGVGKTRLALAAAHNALAAYTGNVAFTPLAALQDPTLLLPTLAQFLDLPPDPAPPLDALTAALRDRPPLLLVLDNIEQLVAAAPQLAALLERCPNLTLLATSRIPLGIRGECQIAVPPLPEAAAVSLFLASAQRAAPAFAPAPADAPTLAAICRRLDGLPLALELAAPRLQLLTPAALLDRLERRESLAERGPLDLPPHQRTLRDTIAWSYDRLDPAEQAIFRLAAVFVGGATLLSVEAVAQSLHLDLADALAPLASLIAKNMLVRAENSADGAPRIRMLETLRDYALEQLHATGERTAVQRAHACHFAGRIEREEHRPATRAEWMARCDEDLPNLRAALQWTMTSGEREIGLRIAGALGTYWYHSGRLNEGMRWLHDLLALAGADESSIAAPVRAKALCMAGWIAADQGRSREAIALLESCVALCRQQCDEFALAEALLRLGAALLQSGEYQRARHACEEALPLYRRLDDTISVINTLNILANVAFEHGDDATAEARICEALPLARARHDRGWSSFILLKLSRIAHHHGDLPTATTRLDEALTIIAADPSRPAEASILLNLAIIAREQQRLDLARTSCERALADHRTTAHEDGLANTCLALGQIAAQQGDHLTARASYAEALTIFEGLSAHHALAACCEAIAALALSHADPATIATLCGAAASLRAAIGTPFPRIDREEHERTLAALRATLSPTAFATASSAGHVLPLSTTLALARSLLVTIESPVASPVTATVART